MANAKSEGTRHLPFSGIILLFLGILFLLQTTGVLPWALWETLWRYWPIVLILIGLRILLRKMHPWLLGLITVVILAATLLLAIWQYGDIVFVRVYPGIL